jgi:CHAD domain-containing protein
MSNVNLEMNSQRPETVLVRRPRRPTPLLATAERALRQRLHVLLENERGTRTGDDIEALHDMRVASRRLREALRVYAELFPPKKWKKALVDLRRITRALGLVREVDVNLEQLQTWRGQLGDSHAIAMEFVMAMEFRRQRRLRKKMLLQLNRIDLEELRQDIVKLLERSHRRAEQKLQDQAHFPAPLSFVSFARAHIVQGLESIHQLRARLAAHSTLRNYHQLRIRIKKFRYMIEVLSRAFESHRARRILKQLKQLQDELGALHDLSMLHTRVRVLRAELRAQQMSLLEKELLRFMRFLSSRRTQQKKAIQTHLSHLDGRHFFATIKEGMKPDGPGSTWNGAG